MLSQLKEWPESVFLQETVEENNLVNVYSVIEVISTLSFSVFVLLMSYITENFGITISFLLSAICLILEAILIYIRRDYLKWYRKMILMKLRIVMEFSALPLSILFLIFYLSLDLLEKLLEVGWHDKNRVTWVQVALFSWMYKHYSDKFFSVSQQR